jgi:RHS repeat-associated protein
LSTKAIQPDIVVVGSVPIGSKSVGDTIKIEIDGTDRDFIVVQHGKPSPIYDDSFDNGTVVMMKDIYENRQWHTSNFNDYQNSAIHSWLNNGFYNLIDASVRNQIKQVKIPFRPGSGDSATVSSGASGLQTKCWLLSMCEVGYTSSLEIPADGAKFSYFIPGTAAGANEKRIALLNGTAAVWWLRTPSSAHLEPYDLPDVFNIYKSGTAETANNYNGFAHLAHGVRPAFVLPSSFLVPEYGALSTTTGVEYTLTGKIKTKFGSGFTATNTYDELGRLTEEDEIGDVAKKYTYDIGGNRTGFILEVDNVQELSAAYEYDELSRLKHVKEGGVTQATYTYDTNGNRESLAYANGTTTTYTYNLANLVSGLQNKKGAAVQSSYGYTYYLDGNQHMKTDHVGNVTTYEYDGLGQLICELESGVQGAMSYAYTYDARNNRNGLTVTGGVGYTVNYHYDLNNRLEFTEKTTGQMTEVETYRYDPNGNTISRMAETFASTGYAPTSISLGGGGWEISEYDSFNQLVKSTSDGLEVEYAYRPDGLRLCKTANGIKTTHIWDGLNIVAEMTGNGVSSTYLRGIGLIHAQGTSAKAWYGFNAHGDVVQLADTSGNVTKGYRYDAFGVERNPDKNDDNPWRYCGEYFDSSSGTYYLRARYYNPSIGCFLTEDPAHARLNWYTYANNNPIMFIDPNGLSC